MKVCLVHVSGTAAKRSRMESPQNVERNQETYKIVDHITLANIDEAGQSDVTPFNFLKSIYGIIVSNDYLLDC